MIGSASTFYSVLTKRMTSEWKMATGTASKPRRAIDRSGGDDANCLHRNFRRLQKTQCASRRFGLNLLATTCADAYGSPSLRSNAAEKRRTLYHSR